MSFAFDSTVLANLKVLGMQGERGLGLHRLILRVDISMPGRPPDDTATISEITGILRVRDRNGVEHHLGRFLPKDGARIIHSSGIASQSEEFLAIELSRGALEAIETVRSGAGLSFSVILAGIASVKAGRRQVSHADLHSVNQGTWIELLSQMGYEDTMLIEVPIPDKSSRPELRKALSYLEAARLAVLQNRNRDAVASCRDVLEALGATRGDLEDPVKDDDGGFGKRRAQGKEERYRGVLRSIFRLTHLAKHGDETAQNVTWDRQDAIAVVSAVAGLLQRHGE
jgi:hypothetical protein